MSADAYLLEAVIEALASASPAQRARLNAALDHQTPPTARSAAPAGGRLLTAREVGERLGLSTETVLRWVRDGKLPGLTLGRAIRFDEDEIEVWLRAQGG